MKALFYPAFDRLELAERPDPQAGDGEVLVRVAACGLCGSELETFKNRSPRRQPPLIMGHEFCGVREDTGERVVSNSLVPCGHCVRCRRGDTHLCGRRQIFGMHRPGAFAERVNVPVRCLIPWPDHLPAAAACLAEPLANGVHIFNLTRSLAPQRVLVIGAGPIGLMCQQVLQVLAGVPVCVADLNPERLAVARRLGAHATFNPRTDDVVQAMRAWTDGEGVDLVVDAVGGGTTKKQSLLATRPGGAVVWIGLHENTVPLDTYDITLPERLVFGTYVATIEELRQALDLMAAGKVDVTSWVQTFSLDKGVEAFQRMLAAQGADLKAVIQP